jgi:hypothetical protein
MGKASIEISFQDKGRIPLNFLSRVFSYQDPQPFPICDILVAAMVGIINRKTPVLKGERNPYLIYLGVDPIKRDIIVSPFGVDAEIMQDAGEIRVGSHKDPVSILEMIVEIRSYASKILFLRLIIEGKDSKV